jgi:CubicO group peptidase (beta-lactamase class C family)
VLLTRIVWLAAVAIIAVTVLGGLAYLRSVGLVRAMTLFAEEHRSENFRSFGDIFPAHAVVAGSDVWEFVRDEQPLPETYVYAGSSRSLADFLADSRTTGLLVARDGVLLHESYREGFDEHARATSFSVAKSFTSALVGIALADGAIASLDDPVDLYLPELARSGYAGVRIEDVLTMSSGIAWDEDYTRTSSDVMGLPLQVYLLRRSVPDIVARLERARAPGAYQSYVSSDSLALGLVVRRATGSSVAALLQERVWIPAGMEASASWNVDVHGFELTHAFLNATLRDFARFGRLYLNEGRRDERQIIPAAWVRASAVPVAGRPLSADGPPPFATFGYGYGWWVPEDGEGDFLAMGIWGQFVYVHPVHRIVIAKTSSDPGYAGRYGESVAAFRAIAASLGASRSEGN